MTEMNGTTSANQQCFKLAALLRECAAHVERNEFHPDMYQALGMLHTYAGEHSGNPNATADNAYDRQISPKTSGSFEHHQAQSAQQIIGSLGKKFSKGLGLAAPSPNQSHAQATSSKNADRAMADIEAFRRSGQPKAEVGHRSKENDWCDEHFCLGCQCKTHQQGSSSGTTTTTATSTIPLTTEPATARPTSVSPTPRADATPTRVNISTTTTTTPAAPASSRPSSNKPAFQRPVNPTSILIANGWIEQQRRSKMRVVWKDVLASLVEGRKPGEETTLWIQRETINPISGKAELEALHQIPMKWLTSIEYLDYSTDHRFALKVYNVPEEFLFRCVDAEAAQNWVLTLRSVREIALKANGKNNKTSAETSTTETSTQNQESSQEKAPVEKTSHRMTISELRAIAHGAGISTIGMERRDLEEAVAKIASGAQSDTQKEEAAAREEELRKRRQEMDEQRRREQAAAAAAEEEKHRKQQALEEAEQRQRMREATERRKRAAAAEEAERRMRAEEEALRRRKLAEEEQRRRQLAEEERRQKLAEEELRRRKLAEAEQSRRLAEEEARRRKLAEEEQRRRHQVEEEARRRKLAEEEQRRRTAEQQAAEQRRRQEEAQRQRWQQQQQQQQQWQQRQQPQQPQQQWQQRQQPQQQWQQQQQQPPGQQPNFPRRAASPPGHAPHPPNGAPSSPVNLKYAKMAAQDDDNGQAVITAIKHNILVHWALQPPLLQMLRPIDVLVTTIHNVFPPAFGVPGHEYFSKWKAVHREALEGPGHRPDEDKMKKSVRKLRFFLHPDKLPRDLNDEQQFMCKMLWDITSDAWEEFEKHKEELDWIRG